MLTTVAQIKKEFFAYRNGVVADTLRRNGDPHEYIMGCQLVDVTGIASRVEPGVDVATELWQDKHHRECRLIAPMLYPVGEMDFDTAASWAMSVECNEIADVLCHRLLRKLPFAFELVLKLIDIEQPECKYVGWRLMLNLMVTNDNLDHNLVRRLIKKEKAAQPPRDIAQLLDSIEEDL